EYEAHAPMAEAKMREIGEGIRARWPGVRRVAMLHRVGRLEIGESSVLIAVSAAHRAEAVEACRHAVDALKRTGPVWKKEHVEVVAVTVERRGSLEAAARAARYAALTTCADRVGATRIALGHTADDQAETVLMRVLQGTGMRGLAGIPPVRDRIIRPLIEC